MKKKIVALTLALCLTSVPVFAKEIETREPDYTTLGIVTNVDHKADTVEVNLLNDHISAFYGAEDWFNGDFALLEMSDNGTPGYLEDDKILGATYEGSLHWIMTGSRGFAIANLDDKGISGYSWYSWDEPEMEIDDNFINMEEVIDFTATENVLQLHLESGRGYWWEREESK